MPTLRAYQETAVEECVPHLDGGVICVMATGGGKTITAVELARRIDRRVLWLAHRRELLFQARDAITAAGGDVGMILAGEYPRPEATIQVASVQTLAHRSLPDADLLVVDECHHVTTTGQYARAMQKYPRRLGLTATPQRLDGRGLRRAGFAHLVVAATPAFLCDTGVLHAPTVYGAPTPDMTEAKIRMGEFRAEDLKAASQTAALTGRVVETWLKRAAGRRTVVFAVDIAHAEDLTRRFVAAGVAAEYVTGETPKVAREGTLARLAAGITTVVVNVGVLTEGWDLPALEVASIARPTASLTLHLQCLGRIMRASPTKAGCLALDHAGNHQRHGFVTDERKWSLDDKPKGTGAAPAKMCPECEAIVAAGCKTCPHCGFVFPAKDRTEETGHDLVQLSPGHGDSFGQRAQRWAVMYGSACRIAGHGTGGLFSDPDRVMAIASAKFKARYGTYPLAVGARLIEPATASEHDWESLRHRWRAIGVGKGWGGRKIAWFIQKCEAEARGMSAKDVALPKRRCVVTWSDGEEVRQCPLDAQVSGEYCNAHEARRRASLEGRGSGLNVPIKQVCAYLGCPARVAVGTHYCDGHFHHVPAAARAS